MNPSQFSLLNAYPDRPAEFTYSKGRGPRSFRDSLGELLLRVARKKAFTLSGGRLRMLLVKEDAEALDLPGLLVSLAGQPTVRFDTETVTGELDDPQLLGALEALGFLDHMAEDEAVDVVDPHVRNILQGRGGLDEVLDGLDLWALGAADSDPEEELLEQTQALADEGRWVQADKQLSEYVGSIESAELIAWRGWVRLNHPLLPIRERVVRALYFARLANKLPFDPKARELTQQIFTAAEALTDSREYRCA